METLIKQNKKKPLDVYIKFIKKFEFELSKNYNLSSSVWEKKGQGFPKKGSFSDYVYKFHGLGCRIEKEGIICEYDSYFYEEKSILFSVWKFFKFIETNSSLKTLSKEDVQENINAMLEEGIISKFFIDNINTGLYEVKHSYIKSVVS